MDRVAPHRATASPLGFKRRDLALLAAIVLGEGALLLLGSGGADPLGTAWLALGALYLLVAFRVPELAWMAAAASVPFSGERVLLPGGAAIAMPSEPMIGLALLGWIAHAAAAGGLRVRPSVLHRPLALLAGIALLSVLQGSYRLVGLKALFVAAAYAAFGYIYFLSTPCTPARRERWVRLASVLAALFGLYGALRVLTLGIGLRAAYGAARPFFTEHGTYAALLALLIPIPLFEALERTGRARWAYASAALAAGLGIALSFTRAAWISVAIVLPLALVVWAWRRRSVRRLVLPVVLGLVLVLVLAFFGAGRRLASHAETIVQTENVSNLERINRWMAAWEMSRDHPLIGVGYGAYPDAYPAYRRKAVVTELAYGHFGVHSEPLRLLAEMGWPGLAVGLGFVIAVMWLGLRTFLRAADPDAARLALALAAGLATYAVHGLFNSYLGIDKVTAPFWLATGAIAALAASTARRRDGSP